MPSGNNEFMLECQELLGLVYHVCGLIIFQYRVIALPFDSAQNDSKKLIGRTLKQWCGFCSTIFVSEEIFCEYLFVRHGMTEFTTKGYKGIGLLDVEYWERA